MRSSGHLRSCSRATASSHHGRLYQGVTCHVFSVHWICPSRLLVFLTVCKVALADLGKWARDPLFSSSVRSCQLSSSPDFLSIGRRVSIEEQIARWSKGTSLPRLDVQECAGS